MKTVVTHLSPDLDAICAVWLIKKYLKGWEDASVDCVPTGSTLNGQKVDSDDDIIHVDTGYGKFDHHDTSDYVSAARLVFDDLKKKKQISRHDLESVDRLVEIVTFSDHFQQVFFPNPDDDYYLMFASDLIHHFKSHSKTDLELFEFGNNILDATLYGIRQKIRAEVDIDEGYVFKSSYGRSIGLNCGNSQSMVLAQKRGYMLVIQKNPSRHFVKIKLHPSAKKNLKKVYGKLLKKDARAMWIYHPSGKMIINGSAHNPHVIASKLSLDSLVDIVKKV
ncbi:hypothetical protein A2690_04615 [Candidatus Roizmanbacteria bacterium RIFCSPHIGHO2_01_FULL_39_12b]|uniref:Uncharacterized protein n=1 Tax=Candidatus Roizmanbacteria bacterium RIFCSPHIGHO2_01_FULL_39_12b TaxID=1802030 RepID=A0A1F7G7T6_9BACT|nr:MAG: hypothetical protein A2690_04615 [Candidatus Roizmanbacteria bacterium RIFCSPHIGHO2_01_FULL_39_12b]